MNILQQLPYAVKENINLFALDTVRDYEILKLFNKDCDYEPCEYSNKKLFYAETRYKRLCGRQEQERNLLAKDLFSEYIQTMCEELARHYSALDKFDSFKEIMIRYSKYCIHLQMTHLLYKCNMNGKDICDFIDFNNGKDIKIHPHRVYDIKYWVVTNDHYKGDKGIREFFYDVKELYDMAKI